uniref:Probable 3-oxoacyl-[acyl-carrier-protein] reductase oxidoreductase (EC) n=1 Tax=Ganoderma boninense TaxID=34458 RepID=A0A5K1K694_9APHY|nr:Probable 3-oxoacyl-[acyl-carrier-protein] reductase oxidoreductase (EC [Ganoderma boninense]
MAPLTRYDPAVLSMFDALCCADANTKELVDQLESALNMCKTDDFDIWEENLKGEIERESMASEIRTLNSLRSTYLYVRGTDVISRLDNRSLQLRQMRDRFVTKCEQFLVALDQTLPELTHS